MYITKTNKDRLRQFYIDGMSNLRYIAGVTGLQRATIRYYFEEFKRLEAAHPGRLGDFAFDICPANSKQVSPRYAELAGLLLVLVAAEAGPVLHASVLYRKYEKLAADPLSLPRFFHHFCRWFDAHKQALCGAKLKAKFTPEERETLRCWRRGNDHRKWQLAVVLETVYTYRSASELADKVGCSRVTLRKWNRLFNKGRLAGLEKQLVSEERQLEIKTKMDNLVHLVQQSPKLYGIDRASWKVADLAEVFSREFKQPMVNSTVSAYLRRRGIKYKRAREVMVSPDPLFKEKYAEIQRILSNLGPREKFFSIDEYGPCSVRAKGGRLLCLPGEQPVFKGVKKGKGYLICTCALELSANQLTHFYSLRKDTAEMIKLVEVLVAQYKDQQTLYLSWDAASWHASKQLLAYLEQRNAPGQTPLIVLAPLPSKTPYLNVIESVFSGMSKAVIRNSDYASVVECKDAIDRYFAKRNLHFLDNPQRAGHTIWGKEKVKPVFHKANICKTL